MTQKVVQSGHRNKRGAGRKKSSAAKAATDHGYVPKQKVTPTEDAVSAGGGVKTTRGGRVSKGKYNDAIRTLTDGDPSSIISPSSSQAQPAPSHFPDAFVSPAPSFPAAAHNPALSLHDFISTIDQETVTLFNDMTSPNEPTPIRELPVLSYPNPDPALASSREFDVIVKWTPTRLFHIYLLAYHHDQPHLCDLVADTWIRAHQKLNADPATRIWQENRSSHYKKQLEDARQASHSLLLDDNGFPELDARVPRFDMELLGQLYAYTTKGCGARALWADALALCGKWLEVRMQQREPRRRQTGLEEEHWPVELAHDVLHVSLRMARKRLTLKIEEADPRQWCERYHEHGKGGMRCYREVYAANQMKEKAEEAAAVGDGDNEMAEAPPKTLKKTAKRRSVSFAHDHQV